MKGLCSVQPEQIETLLLNALRKIDADQEDSRVKIYKAAIRAVDRSDPANREKLHQHLLKTIEQIEKKRAWAARSVEMPDPVSDTPDSSKTSDRLDWDKPRAGSILPKRVMNLDFRWAGLILVAVIGLASFMFWPASTVEEKTSEQARVTAIDDTAPSEVSTQEIEANTDGLLVTINLPQDQEQITGQMMSDTQLPNEMDAYIRDGNFVISEPTTLYFGPRLAVDPKNIYFMSLALALEDPTGEMPEINAGFATFDKDGQLETVAPGSHRYFLHRGKIRPDTAVVEDGEFQISNIISETGNESHAQFRADSAFARAVIIFNPEPGNPITLKKLTITRLAN